VTQRRQPTNIEQKHPIVERQNLTIRMRMRRLTRLTNAFKQEVGEPVGRVLLALRLVQLRAHPLETAGDACDGGGHHGVRVWELADLLAY